MQWSNKTWSRSSGIRAAALLGKARYSAAWRRDRLDKTMERTNDVGIRTTMMLPTVNPDGDRNNNDTTATSKSSNRTPYPSTVA
jgi:hypothetical protein